MSDQRLGLGAQLLRRKPITFQHHFHPGTELPRKLGTFQLMMFAQGPDWGRAIRMLDWEDGDILAIGSSATHPMARVFLGSSATKIIRYAPVPVVAVPGAATQGRT